MFNRMTVTLQILLLFCSVAQSCPTLCDHKNCSTSGLPVLPYLPEFAQTHVHWVSEATQPSHPLLPPSPPPLNLSQHRGLFQWVCSRVTLQALNNSWMNESMETVTDFILGGSKITANDDWSHEIKRHLLLGRKAMTNIDSILKSRDITLLTNVHLVKAMIFPIVHFFQCFWTVVLEKTLESPLDCKEIKPVHPNGNQS